MTILGNLPVVWRRSMGCYLLGSLLLWIVSGGFSILLDEFFAQSHPSHFPARLFWICLASNLIASSAFVLFACWARRGKFVTSIAPIVDPLTRIRYVVPGLVCMLAVAGTAFVYICRVTTDPIPESLIRFFGDSGGLYTLITGAFTIIGVFATLQAVFELRQTFTTFGELIQHVSGLIQTTIKEHAQEDCVRFLAYTPIPGSLALRSEKWKPLMDLVQANAGRIRMVCLSSPALAAMHQLYLGRPTEQGTITQEMIDNVTKKAEQVATHNGDLIISRKDAAHMPRYYIFCNSRRAIIAVPLFLPLPGDGIQPEAAVQLPRVHMFGFVTSDQQVVDHIRETFDLYENAVPNDDGSASIAFSKGGDASTAGGATLPAPAAS